MPDLLVWLTVSYLGKAVGRQLAQGYVTAGVKFTHVHQQPGYADARAAAKLTNTP